jgi:hypothetical protein
MRNVTIRVTDQNSQMTLASFHTSADEDGIEGQELEILSERVAEAIEMENNQ